MDGARFDVIRINEGRFLCPMMTRCFPNGILQRRPADDGGELVYESLKGGPVGGEVLIF